MGTETYTCVECGRVEPYGRGVDTGDGLACRRCTPAQEKRSLSDLIEVIGLSKDENARLKKALVKRVEAELADQSAQGKKKGARDGVRS